MLGVGSLVEGEDSDRVLAQVALVSGVTIGPQVCFDHYQYPWSDKIAQGETIVAAMLLKRVPS